MFGQHIDELELFARGGAFVPLVEVREVGSNGWFGHEWLFFFAGAEDDVMQVGGCAENLEVHTEFR